ncbi:MAG: DUF2163 domain-containing protein [Pseudomonadota bacterium]
MSADELRAHLEGGLTTVARCWALTRRDGTVFGFTDHDTTLSFDGIDFKADTGLTARALAQVTGLAVDNSEALGALSDASVTENDIIAGRFDGAQINAWLVNWANVACRVLQFSGTLGEIKQTDGAFQAELRGTSEQLNLPRGLVYQKPCQAILGDGKCGFDLSQPGYRADLLVEEVEDNRVFTFEQVAGFDDRWFERGRFDVLSGAAEGLVALIKNDRATSDGRRIELWEALRAPIVAGDQVRLEAGCDKRLGTCRAKFQNLKNFRGFPHIPGEDWLMTYPKQSGTNDGGSRFQ